MANYSAARSVHKTLVGGTQDIITLTDTASQAELINRGTDTIYGRVGQTPVTSVPDATVAGDDTFAIPGGGVRVIGVAQQETDLVVKLIAATATAFSVQLGGQ